MAFLGAAIRWPDALLRQSTFTESCEEIATQLRPWLPRPLDGLSSSLLVSLFFTWVLIISVTAASTVLNQRRGALVPAQGAAPQQQAARRRKGAGQAQTTLLIGPEQTGKTLLYSALALQAAPETQVSQQESETKVLVTSSGELPQQQLLHLVDLPGHSRLRSKANDYLSSADRIVFCVDATSASKGGATKNDTLIEAVDHFHATLTTVARSRLSSSARSSQGPPPALLVLFTRGDLSPFLKDNALDSKRQAQVLSRARAGFEAELGRRRTGMGLGRGASSAPQAKVGGMSKVVAGSSSSAQSGWLGYLKSLIGLGGSGSASSAGAEDDDDDDDADEESLDYVDWAWAQRVAAARSSTTSSFASSFSLDKLDAEVVSGGKAHFAVASLGKERSWDAPKSAGGQVGSTAASPSVLFPGLSAFVDWVVDPDV